MKGILEFDLDNPDDANLHQTMLKAADMKLCLWSISQGFRNVLKYPPADMSKEQIKGWKAARELFLNEVESYDIKLD